MSDKKTEDEDSVVLSPPADDDEQMTVDTPLPVAVDPLPNAMTHFVTSTSSPEIIVPVATLVGDGNVVFVGGNVGNTSTSTTGIASNPVVTATSTTRMCTVIAPATLEEGYPFQAIVDGMEFTVIVPEGGVVEGQSFQVPYPVPPEPPMATLVTPLEISTGDDDDSPMGQWTTSIWSCCEVLHTGMFWQGCFLTPILLGQLLTRNKLNIFGVPSNTRYKHSCLWISLMWIAFWPISYYTADILTLLVTGIRVPSMVTVFQLLFTVILATARFSFRRRHRLPVEYCDAFDGRLQDACCGFFCSACILIQMARQTHPEDKYLYVCCSTTGLTAQDAAESIV